MPLFSNKFRQNISNLRRETSNCTFTHNLLTYLEHPHMTPLGFYIFLDNLAIDDLTSIKKISLSILCELGLAALQHQVSFQHNLEDLEKLGILLQIQTTTYKQFLKQTRFIGQSPEDRAHIRQEIERILKQINCV
ncbi:hypothetical protein [Myroides sp. DF42-4-2]|uniref:hypothetical protein n=1 Tax=unclassified Myroides TaxID=2642485 RepID=UPI002577B97D|nr:hypothetical protein [Myroides sp. DF42-4-2]MDM1408364.1 hypothetical protein [Myroides sp. DF42-4-2]